MLAVCLSLVFAVASGERRRSKLPNGSNPAEGSQIPGFAIRQFIAEMRRPSVISRGAYFGDD